MEIFTYLPQIIYLGLLFVEVVLFASMVGHPRTGTNSIWKTLFTTSLMVGLLIWGGFFSHIGVPQIIYCILIVVGIVLMSIVNGTPETGEHKLSTFLIGKGIQIGLFLWGGFFNNIFLLWQK